MSIPLKPFYMLRHGQSEANLDGMLSGSIDVPLTRLGRAQAEETIPAFMSLKRRPTIIVHSHLTRARDTAAIVNSFLGLEMIEDPRIAEQNFGDWEGMQIDSIRPQILAGEDPPEGETNQEFYDRVGEAFTEHLDKHDAPVLFVCHGGIWRALAANYGHKVPPPHNCNPYLFNPAPDNDAFPWNVSDFKSGGFQSALKMP